MATQDLEKLLIQVGGDIRNYQREMLKLNGVTDRAARQAEQRIRRMTRSINQSLQNAGRGLTGGLGRLGAAAGLGLGTKEVIDYADAWTRSKSQLQVAGVETDRIRQKQEQLLEVANRSRTSFETIVSAYQRIGIAARDMGATQAEVTKATETLAKALQLSGATAGESQSAILQFTQALASGVLQGDELRSIRENAPIVAQAIANEFGVTIGQLKELGAAGELESKRILKALLSIGKEIDAQFEQTPETVAQAFAKVGNSMLAAVGKLSETSGATATLVGWLTKLADALDRIADASPEARLEVVRQNILKLRTDVQRGTGPIGAIPIIGPALGAANLERNIELLRQYQQEEAELLAKIAAQRGQTSNFEGKGSLPSNIDPASFKLRPGASEKTKKERDPVQETIDALRFEEAQLKRTSREQEIYNQLQRAGVDISSQYGKTIADLAGKIYDAEMAKRVFEGNQERIQQMQIEAKTMGLTAEAAAYLATKEEMLNEFRREGIAITPELTARIEAEAQAMAKAAGNAEQLQRIADINDTVKDSFKGLISDIASGTEPVDALTNALGRLADKLLDLALDDLFQGLNQNGGGVGGGLQGLFAGLFHSGGIAGNARSGRQVSPLAFAGAPRYHGGGIAGIKPDEVPAILKRGEPILPSMGALKAIAGARQGDNRIIINNNNGSTVRASRENGVTRVDIDDQIASLLSDRNSKVSRALDVSRGARIPAKVR